MENPPLGRAILRLIEPTAGEVIFNGEDITKKNKEQMRLLETGDAADLPGPLLRPWIPV